MLENKTEILAEITKRYRTQAGMTLAEFGADLCEKLPGFNQSKQNIFSWEKGVSAVPLYFATLVSLAYSEEDLRHRWAVECLKVIRSEESIEAK